MQGVRVPKPGECYRHFKGKRYQVIAIAKHVERQEELVIYQGLYGKKTIYARSIKSFTGKVDQRRFPDAKQEYRFELEKDTIVVSNEQPSMIMEFLNLETCQEKIEYLQKIKLDVTDTFLASAAQSLDFTESSTILEERHQNLIHYLKTLMKYEGRM